MDASDKQKFLSSDELRPMNAETTGETHLGEDASNFSEGVVRQTLQQTSNEHEDHDVTLPEIFSANLPAQTKENLERSLTRARKAMNHTQTYVRENPGEAAGLLACSGAIIWALFGTKPGRRIVDLGAPMLNRYISDGINATFGLKENTLQ